MDLKVSRDAGAPEKLANRLLELIESGELKPGDKLPSERELAELGGVARSTVREALSALEMRGLVSRRPGRGSVVEAVARPKLADSLRGVLPPSERLLAEVMDLRAVVEPPLAERAALRADVSGLAALDRVLAAAEEELGRPEPSAPRLVALDLEFHTTVATLAQNAMLVELIDVVNEWTAPSRDETLQSLERMLRSHRAHRRIADAIRAGDPAAAHEAMAAHLGQIAEVIAAPQPGAEALPG